MKRSLIIISILLFSIASFAQDLVSRSIEKTEKSENVNSGYYIEKLVGESWYYTLDALDENSIVVIDFLNDHTCKLSVEMSIPFDDIFGGVLDMSLGEGVFSIEGRALDWDIKKNPKTTIDIMLHKNVYDNADEAARAKLVNAIEPSFANINNMFDAKIAKLIKVLPRELYTQSQQILYIDKDNMLVVYQNLPDHSPEVVKFWNKSKHYNRMSDYRSIIRREI